jgi:hypothetical protein
MPFSISEEIVFKIGNTQLSSNMHPSNEFGPERLIPPEFQVSPANPLSMSTIAIIF